MRRDPLHPWLPALCALLLLAACTDDATKGEAASPAPGGAAGAAGDGPGPGGAEAGTAKAEAAPVTAATLDPRIQAVGPAGGAPTHVAIDFAVPALAGDPVAEGQLPQGTRVRITPELQGEWRVAGPSSLTFVPEQGFAPGARYEVALEALGTPEGVVEAPLPNPWIGRFEVPAFAFDRMTLEGWAPAGRTATVDLVFTGPVGTASLREKVELTVDGRAPTRVDWTDLAGPDGPAGRVHRARIMDRRVRDGAVIALRLPAGAAHRTLAGVAAPAAQAELELEAGEPVRILDVYRAESPGGHYVEVVCDDGAVKEKRWYYDRVRQEGHGEMSRRCQPDETWARRIVVEPQVAFSVSPSAGGFRILGDFQRGRYVIRLPAGLRTVDGGLLFASREEAVEVPARSPQVRLVSQGRYLPRSAWSELPVRHLNVDRLTLTVRQVPPENLVFWMSGEDERADERTSNLIHESKVPVHGSPDRMLTSWIELASRVGSDPRGLLEVTLSAGEAKDTARILRTSLQLVAKRSVIGPKHEAGRKVLAWTLEMDRPEAASGVEVTLIRKSGQVVDRCTTDGDGFCELSLPEQPRDPAPPFAILARRGEDVTYLKFDELKAEVDRARVQGEPFRSERAWRASLYPDRGVYRPGDTAHLSALVRAEAGAAPEAGMPVELTVVDPQGKVLQKRSLPVNAGGLASLDLELGSYATTGRYRFKAAVAGQVVGETPFQVEEFVPERMEVKARPARETGYLRTEPVQVAVEARYLFGGVPDNHRVELACELEAGRFAPRELADFTFGPWRDPERPQRPLPLGTVSGALDGEGKGVLTCPTGAAGGFDGPARLVARASVFESGSGRTTVGRAVVPVHPEPHYLGLASKVQRAVAGQDVIVEGRVVDWAGRLLPTVRTVALELVRLESEYGWSWDEVTGEERWQRIRRPVVDGRLEVPVEGGRFTAALTPGMDAEAFLVRARAGGARTDLELAGRGGWWYAERENRTPRPGQATWLALEAPPQIEVGRPVTVRFEAPWAGRVLLTAETDEVLAREWQAVQAGPVEWTFEPARFSPNVYVTALLVKDPKLDGAEAFLPDRAFGVRSIRVAPTAYTHAVTLKAPAEVRSGSRLEVELEVGEADGAVFATVAAVDEGVLSLTGFDSPDPLKDVFVRRALGVDTFETIGWTLALPARATGGGAGDEEEAMPGRVQAVKPVALWSGIVELDARGRAKVAFDLPQYRGKLRVMAVTAGPQRMGRAEANVVVRDPLVVQTTLPRFLIRGDEVQLPVFVTNLSGAPREVEVTVEARELPVPGLTPAAGADAPVTLVGRTRRTLSLKDGESGVAVFQARARQAAGAATLKVAARSGELVSTESLDVPLLPAGPKTRKVQRLELAEGTLDLTPYLEGWAPMSEQSTFWVTANPYGESFDHLKWLVQYPHGCVEQTTSSTRPLLYVSELLGDVDPTLTASGRLEDKVMHGLDRVLSMQTAGGGFAYWPGGTQPVHWGTAYALHLLLDAQKQGYPVPQDRVDEALAWMERELDRVASNRIVRGDLGAAEPYMHYVLAVGGRGRTARMRSLLERYQGGRRGADAAALEGGGIGAGQAAEHAYLLKAGLWLAGDRRHEADLKRPDASAVSDRRDHGWTFWSDRRARGLMLSVFQDLFGSDPAGEQLAQVVAESLTGAHGGYTTQEIVWGVTGLGKRLKGAASRFETPVLTANGRKLKPQAKAPGARTADRTWAVARASEYESLTLEVPDKDEGRVFLILSSEGVREPSETRYGGEGLALRRRFLGADGKPLDLAGGTHALGDLVYVELTLTNTSADRIPNLALVDRLPAGWEIENPRLGRGSAPPWLDEDRAWAADHLDVRDDRVAVFGALDRGEGRQVVYAARAVTAGAFTLPTAEAEAMYDPRLWARERGGRLEIAGPWSDYLH